MLTAELFGSITRTVSEPMLLVGLSGEILGRNSVMRRIFPGAEVGADLFTLAADDPGQVGDTLRRWARSGEPVAGALALRGADGDALRCHCFGGRASWLDSGREPAVQVRLVPMAERDHLHRLVGLNERERHLRARLEREHEIAVGLQRSLLPERVDGTPLNVAADYAPTARGAEVGGDWYDVFDVPGAEQTALVIGDVAGHGLPEATIMSQLRSVLRAGALEEGTRPERVTERLDGYVDTYLPANIATMCYAVYDSGAGVLSYSNAGHVPPMLLHPDGRCRQLDAALDPPLGCAMGEKHHRDQVDVVPGDLLVLYTDGVVERRGEPLDTGLDRLADLLSSHPDRTPHSLCSRVMEWSIPTGRGDDRAVLVAEL